MILTVTPNPSIDRTVTLGSPLTRGAMHRVQSVSVEPGGKGVNVARALKLADVDAVALLPALGADPLLTALEASGVRFVSIPLTGATMPVRTNITITEPDGTTTKLNEPGAMLDGAAVDALTRAVVEHAARATWVVLSGSLPPGVPDRWYADVAAQLAPLGCRVTVDTSDRPLAALAESLHRASCALLKPNAEELASITGATAAEFDRAMAEGDPEPVIAAATQLVNRGASTVLATLGAAGAVLVDETGGWLATSTPIVTRSTVGAGDAALAGYLRAHVAGAAAPERLRMAVAYGRAAAALPGSALPTPAAVDIGAVRVTPVASIVSFSATEHDRLPHALDHRP